MVNISGDKDKIQNMPQRQKSKRPPQRSYSHKFGRPDLTFTQLALCQRTKVATVQLN